MADTKVSALANATPIGTDYVYLVDDPGGTPQSKRSTVAAVLAVAQASFKNVTDADTGVAADGATDDASAIQTLFNAGGSYYFPEGTYKIETGVNVFQTDHLHVVCHPGAVFDTSGATIEDDLFDWDTNVSGNDMVRFSWVGGIVNISGVTNASGQSMKQQDQGFLRQGSNATGEAFSFRSGYWSDIYIEGVHFNTKQDAHLESLVSPQRQHWMGDYTNGYISGGDSFIYLNSGPGTFTIRDCVFAGSRDSAIYIDGQGNSAATPPALGVIDGCRFFWCTEAVSIKSGADDDITVSNCHAYGVDAGFSTNHQASSGNPGASDVTFENCTVAKYRVAFEITESERSKLVNCRARQAGHPDWANSLRGATGRVTLTGGASGSVDGIEVNSVEIMSGAVNFTSDLETTAAAVVANINANTSSPDYKASYSADPNTAGDYIIYIHTTADAAGHDGDTVVSSTTTITTTDSAMDYMSPDVTYAIQIDGCTGTKVYNFEADEDAAWASAVASARSSMVRTGLIIRGLTAAASSTGGAVQSTDTHIDGLYIDRLDAVGGEVTVSGPTDPDRTVIDGLEIGVNMTDESGPTLLGASSRVRFGPPITKILTSDATRTSTTAYADVSEFTFNLRADATYRIRGILYASGPTSGDMKCFFTDPTGSHDGYWSVVALGSATSSETSNLAIPARTWGESQTNLGLAGTDEVAMRLDGHVTPANTGDFVFQFAQNTSDGTATTLLAGSEITFERIA